MTHVAALMATGDKPSPLDLHAYTETLRLGSLVLHIIRTCSPQFIAGLNPGPAMRKYLVTVWPTDGEQVWPPSSLAEIGGLIALARSLDTGVDVA